MRLPELVVDVRLLDAFVFGPSVLEPNFDLRFGQTQDGGQFGAPVAADVLGLLELHFQSQRLLLAERRPLAPLTQTLPFTSHHCHSSTDEIST